MSRPCYKSWMVELYDQDCPVAHALNVIGEKWTLLILRDLFQRGAMRSQEFQQSLPGIAPNTLSARLKSLEADGIIAGRLYTRHPPRAEYDLTEKGRGLGRILIELRQWGTRHGANPANPADTA